jgi:hypothetical protein
MFTAFVSLGPKWQPTLAGQNIPINVMLFGSFTARKWKKIIQVAAIPNICHLKKKYLSYVNCTGNTGK